MKTAVELYIEAVEELNERCLNGSLSWFEFSDEKKKLDEQAKQMEKEQIMKSAQDNFYVGQDLANGYKVDWNSADEYYKRTYKNTNE